MTRWLVTGAGGMLGRDLVDVLAGRDLTALTRAEMDVTDPRQVEDAVHGHDVVVNTAAYTAVDAAETQEDDAAAVNEVGAGLLAAAARAAGARLVHVSTDYVFDGSASTPYAEDAPYSPQTAYGRTKAAGERGVLAQRGTVIRTAWLYGRHGSNFATTMLRLAGERDTVQVVDDQVGQPTWSRDLAGAIVALVDSGAPSGIYHGTNSGQASWYEFARAIFQEAGLDPARVEPTDSASFARPAPRPAYSVLGHEAWQRAGLEPLRPWRAALADAFARGELISP